MRRFAALTGKFALAIGLALPYTALAQPPAGAGLSIANAAFVGVENPSLSTLLARIGARLTWRPGERDVLITTANHAVIVFTVGDRRYNVGSVAATATYAPYLKGSEPFLPLNDLLAALSLEAFPNGRTLDLEPLASALDVRSNASGTVIVLGAPIPLVPRVVASEGSRVEYAFDGVGSSIAGTRMVNSGGVRDIIVRTTGRLETARTMLIVDLLPDAISMPPRSDDGRDFSLSIGVNAEGATPAAGSQTRVTGVSVAPSTHAFAVEIAVSGDATYVWHHLAAPDNRFWIDIEPARLDAIPRDDRWSGIVTGVRVRQQGVSTVRVALSIAAQQAIAVTPSANGVTVTISSGSSLANTPHSGSGRIGSIVASVEESPQPVATSLVTPAPTRVSSVPTNPRLIVIDPGHGGNDPGTTHSGQEEKTFTLDIAKRLRDVLIARGWEVRMTRTADTEVDPAAVTDHDELQARVDVANENGARIFLSIHVNAYSQPGPNGTTTYYSKPEDAELARDVEDSVARGAGMQNDGVVKSKLYVTLHTTMPAALIETAFITNPNDLARLESPSWRQHVAVAIADGIETYARANPPPAPADR